MFNILSIFSKKRRYKAVINAKANLLMDTSNFKIYKDNTDIIDTITRKILPISEDWHFKKTRSINYSKWNCSGMTCYVKFKLRTTLSYREESKEIVEQKVNEFFNEIKEIQKKGTWKIKIDIK